MQHAMLTATATSSTRITQSWQRRPQFRQGKDWRRSGSSQEIREWIAINCNRLRAVCFGMRSVECNGDGQIDYMFLQPTNDLQSLLTVTRVFSHSRWVVIPLYVRFPWNSLHGVRTVRIPSAFGRIECSSQSVPSSGFWRRWSRRDVRPPTYKRRP